jgi:TatD DNase family protein
MLIDVHCHLNLYLIPDEIISEAKRVGVDKIIAVAMSVISQGRILEICERFDSAYPALGIHPQEVEENENIHRDLNGILDLITMNSDKICALGEIGMDHHFVKKKELYPLQEKIFKKMLELAQKFKLPVILHTKGAEKEVFEILPSYKVPNVDIHWYSGPENLVKEGLDRGYYFSITPAVQYSPPLKKTVEICEPSDLLLESDGPVEYQNQVGTPSMIPSVLKIVSKMKNIPEVVLKKQILENTKTAFPKIF